MGGLEDAEASSCRVPIGRCVGIRCWRKVKAEGRENLWVLQKDLPISRFNREIREKVCVVVYCTPWQLEAALKKTALEHNVTPHGALKNVSPDDVYAGRQDEILKRRAEKKRLTMQRRRKRNRGGTD